MGFGELIIYIKLCLTMWKNDEGMKDKISSDNLYQRKRKNIICLSGQIISFFVEFFMSLVILMNIVNPACVALSVMPIIIILSFSLIAFSQLWTSHELKRYMKFKMMDFIRGHP